jgi:hypothetical protein
LTPEFGPDFPCFSIFVLLLFQGWFRISCHTQPKKKKKKKERKKKQFPILRAVIKNGQGLRDGSVSALA